MKCESWQFYQAKCSVDGLGEDSKISSMAVNTQDSPALCIEDVTFGHDKTGIWVDHGCRATFDVCYIGGESCIGMNLLEHFHNNRKKSH